MEECFGIRAEKSARAAFDIQIFKAPEFRNIFCGNALLAGGRVDSAGGDGVARLQPDQFGVHSLALSLSGADSRAVFYAVRRSRSRQVRQAQDTYRHTGLHDVP